LRWYTRTHVVGRGASEGRLAVLEDVDEAGQEQVEELGYVHVALVHVDAVPKLCTQVDLDLEVYERQTRERARVRERTSGSKSALCSSFEAIEEL